jgi:hypothetical protein
MKAILFPNPKQKAHRENQIIEDEVNEQCYTPHSSPFHKDIQGKDSFKKIMFMNYGICFHNTKNTFRPLNLKF